jgi:cell division protein FtsB
MKTLIGGAAAAVLGIIGLAVWWKPFLQLLAGAIPFGLLSGGALAIYLGFDELKDSWKSKEDEFATPPANTEEVGKYKQEVDDLKKQVEELKTDKDENKEEKEEKKAKK